MKLTMIEKPVGWEAHFPGQDGWQGLVAKIATAFSGRLTLVIEKDGEYFAHITDIPVGVSPVVRRTAELAAGIDIDET